MRTTSEAWNALDLRAHSLLADAPLHDVWHVELPGGGRGRTILDCREQLDLEAIAASNPIARALFGLRRLLGRLFGWDRSGPRTGFAGSYVDRLSDAERAASFVPPGTPDGPFDTLLVTDREWISEAKNRTVHAFSVFALVERDTGYVLYLGIYVIPVGPITRWYMALIDPFRRWVIYPALMRSIRDAWLRENAG